tara:strand:+ start:388 stop:510 length:123 start_codon:yes stop_codon:yes gene_type:complete
VLNKLSENKKEQLRSHSFIKDDINVSPKLFYAAIKLQYLN